MKILYVSSEANPLAASGGLGDVMGALPAAVREEGHEVSVIMPLYDTVKEVHRVRLEKVIDINFGLAWRETGASIFKIEKGAVVKNSVLFHGTTVGKNANLNCIVTDKDVLITDGVSLSGNENMPFYVQKGRKV